MPKASELWGSSGGGGSTQPATASQVPVTPDPSSGLDSDDAQEAFEELAGDISSIQDMPDLSLIFQNTLI